MEREVREVLEAAYQRLFCRDTLAGFQCDQNDRWHRFRRFLDAEAYTDAALMLVPEGIACKLQIYSDEALAHFEPDNPYYNGTAIQFGTGVHPALAIAQAALKTKDAEHAPE